MHFKGLFDVDLFGMKIVCKGSYDFMLTKIDYKRVHIIEKNLIFDKTFSDSDWNIHFSNIFRCTIESRMRFFQYKILLRIIPTNKYILASLAIQISAGFVC